MLLFKRPPKPPGFDEQMEPHRQAVADLVAAGETLTFHEKLWQGFKQHFSDAQHDKCGFCEAYVSATDHGALEHYRPKGRVSTLVEGGEEIGGGPRLRGRCVAQIEVGPLCDGYWWFAYEWTNWLFACKICNSTWKLDLFPLAGAPKLRSPGPGVEDRPLLLSPYGKAEPGRHLRFTDFGQIEGTSRRGRATIRTLGLYREKLRKKRERIALRMYDLIDQALDRLDADEEPDPTAMREILRHGEADHDHAGMVRIVFEQMMPWTWTELEERYGSR